MEGENVLRPSVVFGGGDEMGMGITPNEMLGEAQDNVGWSLGFLWDNGYVTYASFNFYVQEGFESFQDEAMAFCYALNMDVDPYDTSFLEWYHAHAADDFEVLLSAKMSDRHPWGSFDAHNRKWDMQPYVTFRFDS